jgi:hypothetical protein
MDRSSKTKAVIFFIFLISLGNLNCGTQVKNIESAIKITRISEDILPEYVVIWAVHNDASIRILSPKSGELECDNPLVINQVYKISLTKSSTLPIHTNGNLRLYERDTYIGKELVFPKEIEVFNSKDIDGICYVS